MTAQPFVVHHLIEGEPTVAVCEPASGRTRVLGYVYATAHPGMRPGDKVSLVPPPHHSDRWTVAP